MTFTNINRKSRKANKMDIRRHTPDAIELGSLEHGDVFSFNDTLYILTSEVMKDCAGAFLCVALADGYTTHFDCDTIVTPYFNAKVIY